MSLSKFLEKRLVSCPPDANIQEVADLMDSENVGSVLIVEHGRPIGILTDRDIVVRCVTSGADCSEAQAREYMSSAVETISADAGFFEVIRKMRDTGVRRLPVVDHKGAAIGLISATDIMQLLGEEIHDLSSPLSPDEPKIVRQDL